MKSLLISTSNTSNQSRSGANALGNSWDLPMSDDMQDEDARPHNADVILDIYSLYAWSSETIPWTELIPILKHESGSQSSLYDIANFIVHIHKEQ